jgi:hypothetical protein
MPGLDRRQFLAGTTAAVIASPLGRRAASKSAIAELLSHADPILRPAAHALPERQNALPLLERAAEMLTEEPDDEYEERAERLYEVGDCFCPQSPDPERDRLAGAWLESNRRAIKLVDDAVARGRLQHSPEAWSDRRSMMQLRYGSLSRLLRLEVQRLMWSGQLSEAHRLTKTMDRAFELLKGGGGVMYEYANAGAYQAEAWALVRKLATHPQASIDAIRTMLAELTPRSPNTDQLRQACRAEFVFFRVPELAIYRGESMATLFEVVAGWNETLEPFLSRSDVDAKCAKLRQLFEGHPNPFDAIDTVERASGRYTAWMTDFDLPWTELSGRPAPKRSQELTAWPETLDLTVFGGDESADIGPRVLASARARLRQVDNPIGKRLVESFNQDSKWLRGAALSNQAAYDATRIFLALRIYALERGKLPQELEALVEARILDAVPLDPLAEKPFGYSRSQRALWSVGKHESDGSDPYLDDVLKRIDFEKHFFPLDAVKRRTSTVG